MGMHIKWQRFEDGLIKVDSHVNVDFPIFDCRNKHCYATDALTTDPSYLLGICLRGNDAEGKPWERYLDCPGEKAAKRVNTISDWLTDTGMAQIDHRIPRRYYREKEGKGLVVAYA